MALITYFTQKKKENGVDTQAAVMAAAAGVGTYYVTTETEWGRGAIAKLEGALGISTSVDPETGKPVVKSGSTTTQGQQVTLADGTKVVIPAPSSGTSASAWDVLKSWGATGTATVIGTTALSTSSTWQKYIPIGLFLGGLFLLTRS